MFFESLGNFLTGRGWRSDKEREEEEARKSRARQKNTTSQKTAREAFPGAFKQQEFQRNIPQILQKDDEKKQTNQLGLPKKPAPNSPQASQLERLQKNTLSDREKSLIARYNDPDSRESFNKSRQILKGILDDPTNPDYETAKKIAPSIKMNWYGHNAKKTLKDTGDFAKELAGSPVDATQSIPKAFIRAKNEVSGNKKGTELNSFWSKVLGEEDGNIGNLRDYGAETLTGVGSVAGKDWSQSSETAKLLAGLGMGALDASPFLGVAAGIKAGTKNGLRSGILRATGDRRAGMGSDAGGVPQAQVSGAGRASSAEVRAAVQGADIPIPAEGGGPRTSVANPGRVDVGLPESTQTPGVDTSEPTPGQPIFTPEPSTPTPGPVTESMLGKIETKLKRPLTPEERASLLSGQPPQSVVDESSEIGDGISTSASRQAAEREAVSVKAVSEAEANPTLPEQAPELIDPATPVRETLMDKIFGKMTGFEPGFAKIPGRAKNVDEVPDEFADEFADDLADAEPSLEELAAIEAKSANDIDNLSPDNLEVQFLKEDVEELAALIRARERAGVGEASLAPLYRQLDSKRTELENMLLPQKAPTAREVKAAEYNERVREAQENLEKVVANKAPVKAPKETLPEKAPAKKYTAKEEVESLFTPGGTKTNPRPEKPSKDILAGKKKSDNVSAPSKPEGKMVSKTLAEHDNGQKGMANQRVEMSENVIDGNKMWSVTTKNPVGAPVTKTYKTSAGAQKAYLNQVDTVGAAPTKEAPAAAPAKATAKAPAKAPAEAREAAPAKPGKLVNEGGQTKIVSDRQFIAGKKGTAEAPAKATVTPPKKATAKNKAIQAEKQKAVDNEAFKKTVQNKAKSIRKTNKKVDKIQGKKTDGRAARSLEKRLLRDIDDPEIRQALSGLGSSKSKLDINAVVAKVLRRGVKRSNQQVLADINDIHFGLGKDATSAEMRVYASYVGLPKLNRMLKAAKEAGNTKLAEDLTLAYHRLSDTATSGASKAGQELFIESFLAKNASPEFTHARVTRKFKKEFEDAVITEKQDAELLDSYTAVHEAETALQGLKDTQDKLAEAIVKGRRLTKEETAQLNSFKRDFKDQEAILENSLAENERIAGEIYDANVKAGHIKDGSKAKKFGTKYEGWRKAAMLSAPTGRLRDVGVTLGFAVPDQVAVDTVAAALGKILAKNDPSVNKSMGISLKAWAEGSKKGWKNLGQLKRGEKKQGIYLDVGPGESSGAFRGAKSKLAPAPVKSNKLVNLTNAASAAGTEFGRGYESGRILQLVTTEGKHLGLKGKKLKQYQELMTTNPKERVRVAAETDFLRASSMHDNLVYRLVEQADHFLRNLPKNAKTPFGRWVGELATREGGLLSLPFKRYASGSIARFATDQNILYNPVAAVVHAIKGEKAAAIEQASRTVVNGTKISLASAALLPFLEDEDADGNSYSPPYLHVGEHYIPLASLGPVLAAPLGTSYAIKKATQDGGFSMAEYAKTYGTIMFQSTGMDNLLAGDSPIGRALRTGFQNNSKEEANKSFDRTGGRFLQDWTTQWVPAASRDLNSVIDLAMSIEYAPDTRVENEDGTKNYLGTAGQVFLSGIPGIRQYIAKKAPSEKAAQTPLSRLLGSTHDSEASAANRAEKEDALSGSQSRIESVADNDKVRDALDKETQKLFDKFREGKTGRFTQSDYDSIESGFKKAEKGFLEKSDYSTYISLVEARRSKLESDPTTEGEKIEDLDFDLTAAKTLKQHSTPYRLYQLYGGGSSGTDPETGLRYSISDTDMRKLLDADGDFYNPTLANKLLNLDKRLAKAGVSDNEFSSKTPKYKKTLDKLAGKSGSGGSGGSGGKQKVITDVGSVSSGALRGGKSQKLQYRDVKTWNAPIPNLSKQASKTNFKKKISVKKGVAL